MKERDILLKVFLKSGLTIDRQRFTSMRNKTTQTLRKAKANFFMDVITSANGNGKLIWQNINKLIGKQNKMDNDRLEIKVNNKLINNPKELATEFNNFFINSVNEITQMFSPSEIACNPIKPRLASFQVRANN